MPCQGCARRAKGLFKLLGLHYQRVGPNQRAAWLFETPDVAVLVPSLTARHRTTRSTLLVLVTRLLFGKSRAVEEPTPTEVWRLRALDRERINDYFQDGATIQAITISGNVEVRRAPWLRLVGPIEEQLRADEVGSIVGSEQHT